MAQVMPESAQCPHCGKSYRLSDATRGARVRCKKCGDEFVLPHSAKETIPPSGTLAGQAPAKPGAPADVPQRLGRFHIRQRLGLGAFGTVYLAFDEVLQREVALKVPQMAALETVGARARFLREPKAAAQLRHPNIVPVFDAGSEGDVLYIASAYIRGQTLEKAISDARMPFRQAAKIVMKLADALDYAHLQGVVHRDVKPANIMLDEVGEPHLMDFGLALWEQAEDKLTHDGALLGTPAYMSPEQAGLGHEKVGPASDQYSLGVVLYELICGTTPFSGPPLTVIHQIREHRPPSPRSVDPTVPYDLEIVCLKALAKLPGDRYPTCRDFAYDLGRWLDDEPTKARPLSGLQRGGRWTRRNPLLATLGGLVAALLLAIGIVLAISNHRLGESRDALARALTAAEEKTQLAEASARRQAEALEQLTREVTAREEAQRAATQAAIEREAARETAAANEKARGDEEAARTRAEQIAANAKRSQDKAEQMLLEESKARELSESARAKVLKDSDFLSYLENVRKSSAAVHSAQTETAFALLEACPEAMRSWEWYFLRDLAEKKRDITHSLTLQFAPPTRNTTQIGHGINAVVSPDGMVIAVHSPRPLLVKDKKCDGVVIDIMSRRERFGFDGRCPVFSDDGNYLVLLEKHGQGYSGSHSWTTYNVTDGKIISQVRNHRNPISVHASATTVLILTTQKESGNSVYHALDTVTGKISPGAQFGPLSSPIIGGWGYGSSRFLAHHTHDLRLVALLANRQVFSQPLSLKVLDAITNDVRLLVDVSGDAEHFGFSPKGDYLAAIAANKARIWNTTTGLELADVRDQLEWLSRIGRGAISADGRRLLSGENAGLKFSDLVTGYELLSIPVETKPIQFVLFSPNGRHIAIGDNSGTITFLEADVPPK